MGPFGWAFHSIDRTRSVVAVVAVVADHAVVAVVANHAVVAVVADHAVVAVAAVHFPCHIIIHASTCNIKTGVRYHTGKRVLECGLCLLSYDALASVLS